MTNIKVFASPRKQIPFSDLIIWQISYQRKKEQMFTKWVLLEGYDFKDPKLNQKLSKDVIQALIKKYGLGN